MGVSRRPMNKGLDPESREDLIVSQGPKLTRIKGILSNRHKIIER